VDDPPRHSVRIDDPPHVSVRAVACRPVAGAIQHPGDAARWQVAWLVHNLGTSSLELDAAWIPHGRFRGDGRLQLAVHLGPEATHELDFVVTATEAPQMVVENAFLILQARANGHAWRIFIRMRIEFDAGGVPWPVVESITTQSLK
jgi:hypothetical protein